MLHVPPVITRIETVVWAIPEEGMSLRELQACLTSLGHAILKVDSVNNRIAIQHEIHENPGA